jgi:hypothetical protein
MEQAKEVLRSATGFASSEDSSAQTSQTGVHGSEQDRYASHFGLGNDGLKRVQQLGAKQGLGAEQDVHAAHLSFDKQKIQEAKDAMFKSGHSGAAQDRYQGRFGFGNDGLDRVKAIASTKGVGSEQERYVSSSAQQRSFMSPA